MIPAVARWFLGLCILTPFVTSSCPNFPDTNGTNLVTVHWTYDMYYGGCPNITMVGSNPCLRFRCDPVAKIYRLDGPISCESGCTSTPQMAGSCPQQYSCAGAIYDEIPQWSYTDWYRYRHGWFSVFSGYTCGTTGSGPCDSTQCFSPFVSPASDGSVCVPAGQTVHNNLSQAFVCQTFTDCEGNPYVDLVQGQSGCSHQGRVVAEGTVVYSDPCNETVCVVINHVGSLVNRFKGQAGCVFGDQCVTQDATVSGTVDYVCANLTCRYDGSLPNPYVMKEQVDTGCYYKTKCYKSGAKAVLDKPCKLLQCSQNAVTGKFFWNYKYTGCYDPFTNQCVYKNGYSDVIDNCVKRTCDAAFGGKWRMSYLASGSCVPDPVACNSSVGVPGCQHKGQCYPVKSVIPWDNCSQYVCYSDNADLNNGIYTAGTALPAWRVRPTGCYGPKGCMKRGTQWVDPVTLNTYRCGFDQVDWGTTFAQFHQACIAPNGTVLKLGSSVKVGSIWYSCYRWGKMLNPIDTSVVFVPTAADNHSCGENPDTKRWLYKTEYYYTPGGRCRQLGWYCLAQCDYFDQPCTHTDLDPYRWLGDTFTLNNSECVCTQDYNVNNKPFVGSLFDTPSLCSQDGVANAACRDTADGSLHQWGELWVRKGSSPLVICGCHPLLRQEVCSTYLPDVIVATTKLKI